MAQRKRPFECRKVEKDETGLFVDVWGLILKSNKEPTAITLWNKSNQYSMETLKLAKTYVSAVYKLQFDWTRTDIKSMETFIFVYDDYYYVPLSKRPERPTAMF
jgi:hypothetical protein